MLDVEVAALAALLRGASSLVRDERELGRTLRNLRYPEAAREAALDPDSRLTEALVARVAGRLAASGEERGRTDPGTPLNSIFNSVQLDNRARPRPRNYLPTEYGGGNVRAYLPEVTGGNGDRGQLEDAFVRKLGGLAGPDVGSLMNLLERYGSYVRSEAGTGDISIFDHSRASAALAVCIAGHLNCTGEGLDKVEDPDAERYYFVQGDLSGVQKFIYTITSKGALRMLRARSFFLELVAEHAVAELLQRSGAPRTNVIFVGGGGFQLLLPNTPESKEAVETVERELNADLEKRFGHDLYLAMAATPCGALGIAGDGLVETLRRLGKDLSDKKARKFHESLPRLLARQDEPGLESCDVCARDDVPVRTYESRGYELWRGQEGTDPIELCETCHMLARASRKLVSDKYLVRGHDLRVGGTGYGLSSDGGNALYALDGIGDDACLNGAVPLPAARYVTRDEEQRDQIMDFDKLSKKAEGISRLAVLRMDVDNLGETFRSGLPENMRTFSRYAALSRSFTTFFKMVLPEVCKGGYENGLRLFSEEGSERAASVVYSGGDDLFIVGAWSDVLELAVDIRRAFREFVCENPSVTLSAGISIHSPGEPLYLMAEQAGAAEAAAKENEQDGRKKDSAVLFYGGPEARRIETAVPEALFWDEAERVIRLLEWINEFRDNEKLPFPRGFTRLLLDVVEVYEQDGHLSLPRLAYALARMEEGDKKRRDDARWRTLKEELLKIETVKKLLRPAATPTWVKSRFFCNFLRDGIFLLIVS